MSEPQCIFSIVHMQRVSGLVLTSLSVLYPTTGAATTFPKSERLSTTRFDGMLYRFMLPNQQWSLPKDWISTWINNSTEKWSKRWLLFVGIYGRIYRCCVVFNNNFSTPQNTIHRINSFLHDKASVNRLTNIFVRVYVTPKWSPSDKDVVKMNTYVSFCHRTYIGGSVPSG